MLYIVMYIPQKYSCYYIATTSTYGTKTDDETDASSYALIYTSAKEMLRQFLHLLYEKGSLKPLKSDVNSFFDKNELV